MRLSVAKYYEYVFISSVYLKIQSSLSLVYPLMTPPTLCFIQAASKTAQLR